MSVDFVARPVEALSVEIRREMVKFLIRKSRAYVKIFIFKIYRNLFSIKEKTDNKKCETGIKINNNLIQKLYVYTIDKCPQNIFQIAHKRKRNVSAFKSPRYLPLNARR